MDYDNCLGPLKNEQDTSSQVKEKEIKKGYCLCGREVKNYKLETCLQCFKETHTLCENCCWKDRCSDEDCNHRYRPECTECNGRGWIVKPQVIRSFTTEELNEELERRDPPPMSDESPGKEKEEVEKLCRNCFDFRKACCPTPGLCYCNGWKQSEPQGTITLAEATDRATELRERQTSPENIAEFESYQKELSRTRGPPLKDTIVKGKELPKQIVMIWQCGHCGAIYGTQADADECHEDYGEKSWLMSDGTIWDDSCFNFDQETMVTDSIQGKELFTMDELELLIPLMSPNHVGNTHEIIQTYESIYGKLWKMKERLIEKHIYDRESPPEEPQPSTTDIGKGEE